MKFAHFSHIWAKPGMTPHQRYEQLWRELAALRRSRFRLFVLCRASLPPGRKLDILAEPLCGRRRRAHQTHAHWADGLHRAALPSAAAGGGDRHRRPDVGRAHGARTGARHQPRLLQAVRLRLQFPQVADAGIRRLSARGLRRDAAVLISRRQSQHRQCRNLRAADAAPASAALDDEPRSADAGVLRHERHQSRLFPDLPARRRRAALSRLSRQLAEGRLAAQTQYRLLHHHLCRRERREGARRRAQARFARLRRLPAAAQTGRKLRRARARACQALHRPRRAGRLRDHGQCVQPGLPDEERTGVHRFARDGRRQNPQDAPKLACSTSAWASSISPTCRSRTCCARSSCSARK